MVGPFLRLKSIKRRKLDMEATKNMPTTQADFEFSAELLDLAKQAEAQAAKIEAEGEAEYMRILSEAYADESRADFYSFGYGKTHK